MSTSTDNEAAGSAAAEPAASPTRPNLRAAAGSASVTTQGDQPSQHEMIWGVRAGRDAERIDIGPLNPHGMQIGEANTLRRLFSGGWRRWLFPGVWLIYLLQTAQGVDKHTDGLWSVLGWLILVVFSVLYLAVLPAGWIGFRRPFQIMFAGMLALVVVESLFAHEDALPMLVYVAVICVAVFGRLGLVAVAVLTAISAFVPALIPSWHTGISWDSVVTLPLVALAMFGFFAIIRANRALTEARAEVARLAAENERTRIARDLHDLLGHSLTTITVKAGLARRLAERDPDRAAAEIAEVEELTRRSLTQVRAAVAGYREVTLAGELATSREVLRSAGIESALPKAIDEVRPEYDELFGWVLREAVTNVVRHSRATRCTVRVGVDSIEIEDNGPGVTTQPDGNGLTGIRERVEAAGGHAKAGRRGSGGWRVHVTMDDRAAMDAPRPQVDTSTQAAIPGAAP